MMYDGCHGTLALGLVCSPQKYNSRYAVIHKPEFSTPVGTQVSKFRLTRIRDDFDDGQRRLLKF